MSPSGTNLEVNRRQFLSENAMGVGMVALATLLGEENLLAVPKNVQQAPVTYDMQPRKPHGHPTAKAMISLFQHGGPAHMELMDPKPELTRLDGKTYDGEVGFSFIKRATKTLKGSSFKFSKHGECGTEISELLPGLSSIVDDVCVIRSMHTGHNGHEVSIRYMNAGIAGVTGRPSLGSWITYGLGSVSQNLPAYMVLTDPAGTPVDSTHNWSNGWMPSLFQGTVLRPKEPRILNLAAPAHLQGTVQASNLSFLNKINRRHLDKHPGEHDLEARIASYELAARMQDSAREALDISQETKATQQLYGIDQDVTRDYGTRCLIARRMVERGVRFVQLFHSGQPWDNHTNLINALPSACRKTDVPSSGLVKDLKQRGMLDEVLVHWGGEIGRLPVMEGDPKTGGRDHNGQGFSTWLAGGGIQGGMTYGNTDDVGHRAVENIVKPNDYQATVLHLFGLDHNELYYLHNGQEQKLVVSDARIVNEIIA
ncbi:MAG: DUF1501 domain-containing protein [Pirellulaceae bacterium]|jgi:hypothetical protein|nr:DUF1501 domain-containing protein [Pirellulaceae bacterium]